MLGVSLAEALAVSFALETDLAGAAAAGIASCWVLGGIHGERLQGDRAAAGEAARLAGVSPGGKGAAVGWG